MTALLKRAEPQNGGKHVLGEVTIRCKHWNP